MKIYTFTEKELIARDKLYYELGFNDGNADLPIYGKNIDLPEDKKAEYLRNYYNFVVNYAEQQAKEEELLRVSEVS